MGLEEVATSSFGVYVIHRACENYQYRFEVHVRYMTYSSLGKHAVIILGIIEASTIQYYIYIYILHIYIYTFTYHKATSRELGTGLCRTTGKLLPGDLFVGCQVAFGKIWLAPTELN